MSNPGWFAMNRNWFGHESFKRERFTEREAFAWLIAEAAFDKRTIRAPNGRGHSPVTLNRGELCHSYEWMADKWGWTYKEVRTFLKSRERWVQIERRSGRDRGTDLIVIYITNYDVYQSAFRAMGTDAGAGLGTDRAHIGQQEKQLNNLTKNTRSRGGEPEGFAAWYLIYPRKRARHDAGKAYCKLINSGGISHADLMARTELFAAHWRAQPRDRLQFCPYPASWLNSGEYADEIEAVPSPPSGGGFKIEAPTKDARTFTVADWRDRLGLIEGGAPWPSDWGPKPGEPGCLVPVALLGATAQPAEPLNEGLR